MARYYVRETLKPVHESLDTMEHFIHDAGHEMKTPLAIISGNLQLMRDTKKLDVTLIDESITTIMSMTGSLDSLLELAMLEEKCEKEELDLEVVIEEELAKYTTELEKKHLQVEKNITKGTIFVMGRGHFSLFFGNLLGNAIKYNRDHGKIEISQNE
jgi:signal transduction histidine kinase